MRISHDTRCRLRFTGQRHCTLVSSHAAQIWSIGIGSGVQTPRHHNATTTESTHTLMPAASVLVVCRSPRRAPCVSHTSGALWRVTAPIACPAAPSPQRVQRHLHYGTTPARATHTVGARRAIALIAHSRDGLPWWQLAPSRRNLWLVQLRRDAGVDNAHVSAPPKLLCGAVRTSKQSGVLARVQAHVRMYVNVPAHVQRRGTG